MRSFELITSRLWLLDAADLARVVWSLAIEAVTNAITQKRYSLAVRWRYQGSTFFKWSATFEAPKFYHNVGQYCALCAAGFLLFYPWVESFNFPSAFAFGWAIPFFFWLFAFTIHGLFRHFNLFAKSLTLSHNSLFLAQSLVFCLAARHLAPLSFDKPQKRVARSIKILPICGCTKARFCLCVSRREPQRLCKGVAFCTMWLSCTSSLRTQKFHRWNFCATNPAQRSRVVRLTDWKIAISKVSDRVVFIKTARQVKTI